MKKLSEADIRRELETIAVWPSERSWVYMKNLYDGRTGYVMGKADRNKEPFELRPSPDNEHELLTFESLGAAIGAGWVVD